MSYSSEKKDALASQIIKKRCCRKVLLYGLMFPHSSFEKGIISFTTDSLAVKDCFSLLLKQCFSKEAVFTGDDGEKSDGYALLEIKSAESNTDGASNGISEICEEFSSPVVPKESLFVCDSCKSNFVKGVFISSGMITNPEKSIHLEMLFTSRSNYSGMKDFLSSQMLMPKEIERRGNPALYFKKQEEIEDFLAIMGDSQGAMQIMNLSIMKSLRNNANRYSNCDAANLYKATEAASFQIQAINKLMENGSFDELPHDLKMTAELRVKHPELTLSQLAEIHNPPITKSGVNHRLQKLLNAASKL